MNENNKEILTLKDVMELLSLSDKTIYKMIKENTIPYKRIGKQYRFNKQDLIDWFKIEDNAKEKILDKIKKMPDTYVKRLLFVAYLTGTLEKYKIKPIIVGGNAVAFYTSGGYATADIDIITDNEKKVEKILNRLGFIKTGKDYYSKEYDIAIEFPSGELAGDHKKISKVEIGELYVYIIGIEDIIQDRLNAYVHWKSTDDYQWAKQMATINYEMIDWKYLEKRSIKEQTLKAFKKLQKEIEKYENENH